MFKKLLIIERAFAMYCQRYIFIESLNLVFLCLTNLIQESFKFNDQKRYQNSGQ